MSRQMIAGNWKMNGLTAEADALAAALLRGVGERAGAPGAELLVCPPFTQIAAVSRLLAGSDIRVGGQDCSMHEKGAHTGDVSPSMLRDLGATHVILGHSERRQNHNELDETVREKCVAARRAGLVPIVCVGETAEQRSADGHEETVGWQLKGSLPDGFADEEAIVAYEPVWAIGTGRTATAEDVAAMHGFIRAELKRQFSESGEKVRILYGGSVNAGNAATLLAIPEVGGALVGGASLKPDDFLQILSAAQGG
ncbi:triose-phosphate isomerase [Rhizosaccharibacter radicis]|uniref:Triosephosphate isomerase n=1 Tax=Rhizosaccharibacter radicis TaxID=2782605 RepID=A0ABT1VV69_9PROT|nr:triose-phosphate isomerase [Acetobacteraceae bacterium KSS12]